MGKRRPEVLLIDGRNWANVVRMPIEHRLARHTNKRGPYPHAKAVKLYPEIEGKRCWEWEGKTTNGGYGEIFYAEQYWKVHRLTWDLRYGHLPETIKVCHKCDNVKCRRPSHLFLGTQRANMRDCVRKRRHSRGASHGARVKATHADCKGELNSASRFKDREIPVVRRMYATGLYSYQDIADMYNVTKQAIRGIVVRSTYKHVR